MAGDELPREAEQANREAPIGLAALIRLLDTNTTIRLATAFHRVSHVACCSFVESKVSDRLMVAFSHGVLMDREMFTPNIAALNDTFRCIVWDSCVACRRSRPSEFWIAHAICMRQ